MTASVDTGTGTIRSADSRFESSRRYPRQGTEDYCRYEAFADGTAVREAVLNELLGLSTPGARQVHPRLRNSDVADVAQSFADGSAQRQIAVERAMREGKQ